MNHRSQKRRNASCKDSVNKYHPMSPHDNVQDPCLEIEQETYAACEKYEHCDRNPTDFHDLYLQKDALEFMTPIVFEDGMDYVECELYYTSIRSQEAGGSFRGAQEKQGRQSCFRDIKNLQNGSCLKTKSSKRSVEVKASTQRKVRRCSFGGLPKVEDAFEAPPLLKANSSRSILQHKPRVAFEEYVQVVTIHPIDNLPIDVRSQMWMSRQEMFQGVRRAAMEEREKQLRQQNELAKQEHLALHSTEPPAVNSVIAECIQSASIQVP